MVNPDQVILQFATEIFDVFFLLKMGKKPIEQKELCFLAWDETAEASQIMQLSEGASEGGFPALVRTGDDHDALLPLQVKIIADNGRVFGHEFIRQSHIKSLIIIDFLALIGHVRITKWQSLPFESCNILQISDIKLYFPIKNGHRFIQIRAVFRAVISKMGK